MKFLFDLFPVLAFFGAYMVAEQRPADATTLANNLLSGLGGQVMAAQAPILLATLVAIIATTGQVGYVLARGRKVDKMLWISLGIIVVMGGATLIFRDTRFIRWKPTVLYWAFAAILLASDLLFNKNLLRRMMQEQMSLPASIWTRLNLSWAAFFAVMGILNLYVAYTYPESVWVKFKLFGTTGLMVLFIIAQALMLSRFVESEERK
jgi:intracellular septation protein